MLKNVNRSVAALLCVLLVALGGCSESEADGSASPVGDQGEASSTTQPEEQSNAAPSEKPEPGFSRVNTQASSIGTVADQDRKLQPSLRATGDGSDRKSSPAQPTRLSVSGDSQEMIVKAEPSSLDLGTVGTGQKAKGTIRLVNTGDKPMRIINCKANCGCTTTNCPRNKELQPGESVEVEVQMTAGAIGGRRQSKRVDFIIEGQPLLRVPVSADVVAYVEIEPKVIDLGKETDGRVVIRALDEQAFKVLAMNPPWIETFDDEARLEHVLYLPTEQLEALSRTRRIEFTLDHPQANKASLSARKPRAIPGNNSRITSQRAAAVVEDALVIAARSGDVAAITQAVKDGKNLELLDNDGATLLGVAARAKQVEVVRVLLEAGANLEALDRRGRSPLMAAVQTRQSSAEVVKALIAQKADVNTRDTMIGGSPLSWAAGPFGNPEIVAALVAADADVNTVDTLGMTPLMWAVRFGGPSTVKTLVDAGADLSVKNAQGQTPLDLAREKGGDTQAMETIKILEAKSATSEEAAGTSDS